MMKKKIVGLLTSAAMAIGIISVFPFSGQVTYAETALVSDDFEVSYDGWTNRGDLTELTACMEAGYNSLRGMRVTNRQTPEDGAFSEKGFYLDGGVKYDYSVFVCADSEETFYLSLRWLYPDGETYESAEIASVTAQPGQWTELSAKYAAPKGTVNLTLSITTGSTADFCFDDVTVTQTVKTYANTVNAATANVGLKDIYANKFRVGSVLNSSTVRNNTITANMIKEFNSITCENEMKPYATMTANGSTNTNINVTLSQAAAILDFCSKNNIAVRGHTLVWHGQTPTWFFMNNFTDSGTPVSKDVMEQRLESYIKNLFNAIKTQYPTLNLYAYDVVNEAVSDDSSRTSVASGLGGARPGGFEQGVIAPGSTTGGSPWVYIYGDNSFIERAFTYARKYAPATCKLFYNDYNEFWDHKRDCIIRTIVRPLYEKGLLDGMGMQSHLSADTSPNVFGGINAYNTALNMYAEIGCEVQITELDVSTNEGKFTLGQQADRYKSIFETALDVNKKGGGKVTAIVVWGPNDANTWIGSQNAPLLFDGNNQKKSAYNSVASIVPQSEWGDGNNPNIGGDIKPIEPDENGYFFHCTYEDGTLEGWDERWCTVTNTSAYAYAGSRSLFVSGRDASYTGVSRTLNTAAFIPGNEYSFSAMAMYTSGAAEETFCLTLQYDDAAGETYWPRIAEATAKKGQWVQLKNTNFLIPAGARNIQIYMENGSTIDFYADETIGAVAGTNITMPPKNENLPGSDLSGDVNGDGKIDGTDVKMLKEYVLGFESDLINPAGGDLDEDGNINVFDVVLLKKMIINPSNHKPTTEPPNTELPNTEPPNTELPITAPPTTEPPVTEIPNTSATMYANFRAGQSSYFEASDGWTNGDCFDCVWRGSNATFLDNALNLKIDRDSSGTYRYSGAEYRTKAFYHYGYYETSMQAIKNDGVVSSFFTYTGPSDSNPWDEIDIEILGKDTKKVQLNYYTNGVGNHEYMYDLGFDASLGYHTYGFDWQPDRITWYVDGKAVYTATSNIPKTPGKIMMNVWPGIGVDNWLKPYDGKTPLTARYQWVTYNAN